MEATSSAAASEQPSSRESKKASGTSRAPKEAGAARSQKTSTSWPAWSRAVKSAALEAASSSTRGSGWAPSGSASSWECRAVGSRQARPEEAQAPSWGAAKGAL
eukprot:scaffold13457_cov56-Phaeocystis_antarctica.AAC.4